MSIKKDRYKAIKELAWCNEVIVDSEECGLSSITGPCGCCVEVAGNVVGGVVGGWSADTIVGVGLAKEKYERALETVLSEPTQSILRVLNRSMKECFLR